MQAQDLSLSRRGVLLGTAGLFIGVTLPASRLEASGEMMKGPAPGPMDPNAYVHIGTDSSVTVIVKHIEMGQGVYTGLSTLVAEELDADWAQVRAEAAPENAALYGNFTHGGLQGTGGSSSLFTSFDLMRRAGATARAMLVQAAAQRWGVAPGDIRIEKGVISHKASGRSGRFGEFAAAAAALPAPQDVKLKDPADYKLIGRDKLPKRVDTRGKTDGTAQYALDINEPGMLTVLIARPPRFGAKPAGFDPAAAMKVKGVVAVKQVSNGFAVYATGMWAALKGREALSATWNEDAAEPRGSEEMIAEYLELTKRGGGTVVGKRGDVDAALAAGGTAIEASYVFPFLAHAPMEPLDGYIKWTGNSATVRYGCQLPTLDRKAVAKVLGLPEAQVDLHTMIGGSSFGRRGQVDSQFPLELAEVAKAIGPGKALKLVWTREDDIKGGYYRPLFVHRLKGVVKDGKITAWQNNIAGQSFLAGTPFGARMKDGIDPLVSEGASDLLYALPNFRCETHKVSSAVSTSAWRSVGHNHTGFAVECFMDQLLNAAGKDPVAGRIELLANEPRAIGVLRAVAEMAKWNGPGPANGRVRGVAFVKSFRTYVAEIAEVSLGEDGVPKVHKVWCAVDCGLAINPDVVRSQMESAIGLALGAVLYGEISLVKGAVQQSNFDGYEVLRIDAMPEVQVHIVPSKEIPTGVGEPGVPPLGPAVANAVARLTKTRDWNLPMSKMKLKTA